MSESSAEPIRESETVTRIREAGREIIIIGTAHVSHKSVDEVRRVIAEEKPDVVCVELDAQRHEALMDASRWRKLDLFKVIRENKVLFLAATVGLSAYQRKMGARLGIEPGAEMKAAIEGAKSVGAEVVLADRDIQITLRRTWRSLRFADKLKITGLMFSAPFMAQEISEEQIESLKDRDTIGEMLDELAKAMPELKTPLIDERDQWLMSSVEGASGKRIVAVVGAGHVRGMLRGRGQPVDRDALSVLPPPSRVTAALKWVIPAIVLLAFAYGASEHSGESLEQMLYAWIIPNAVAAGLFAVLAGAKPLTIVTAFVASPITSLNPTIGAGMVSGLVEAWLRKPTVEETERVAEDAATLRGWYRNGVTRVLLVFIMTTLGSALGAWVGASWVVSLL